MHTISTKLSALALLVAGSSVAADSQTHLLTTHVRSLGMKTINKAYSRVLVERRMEKSDGINLGDVDLSDIDIGALMAGMAPLICGVFESLDMLKNELENEMPVEGMVCSEFGCDDPNSATPNLIMNCNMDDEVCEEENGEQFCIANTEIQMSMGLDFVGTSQMTSTQCSNYTSPGYMAAMGRGCWEFDASLGFGDMVQAATSGMMEAAISGEVDAMTEEEVDNLSSQHVQLTECSAKFDDGTECTCGICNEGMGFELTCTNDLITRECALYTSNADAISQGEVASPAVSVIKLSALPNTGNIVKETDASDTGTTDPSKADEMSPAASCTGTMAATIVLVFASFLALA